MAVYRRYVIQQKYVNGVATEEYRLGGEVDGKNYHSLEDCEAGECTDLEYQWVDVEGDYICEGYPTYTKYAKQKHQQRCKNDPEAEWVDIYPYEYQKGDVIEEQSRDCGYGEELYYLYNDGTERTYPWSSSVLSQGDNGGTSASVIIDKVGLITKIPMSAFLNCSYLQSVSFPMCSVVNSWAFAYCSSLSSFNMPYLSYIGEYAFAYCTGLSRIDLKYGTYIGSEAFEHCSNITSAYLGECSYIGNAAFLGCYRMSSVTASMVSYVGTQAFMSCWALSSISLPNCSYIGSSAFDHCSSFTDIYLDYSSVVSFGSNLFDGCSRDLVIHVPDELCESYHHTYDSWYVKFGDDTTISMCALFDCNYEHGCLYYSYYDGTEIEMAYASTTLVRYSSHSASYVSVVKDLCGNIINVGTPGFYMSAPKTYSAFSNMSYLTSATFPALKQNAYSTSYYSGRTNYAYLEWGFTSNPKLEYFSADVLEVVPSSTFYYDSSLKTVYLPQVKTISSFAFQRCYALPSISLPNCETIDMCVFQYCSSLSYAYLPNCSFISSTAFGSCYSLESIDVSNLQKVYYRVFENCALSQLSVPKLSNIGWQGLGFMSNLTSITLPSASVIDSHAFIGCTNLSAVYLTNESVVCQLSSYLFASSSASWSSNNYSAIIYVPCDLYSSYINLYGSIYCWNSGASNYLKNRIYPYGDCVSLTLTLSVNDTAMGSITALPSMSKYMSGMEVTVTPSAYDGYFLRWYLTPSSILTAASSLVITMTSNYSITAVYGSLSSWMVGFVVSDDYSIPVYVRHYYNYTSSNFTFGAMSKSLYTISDECGMITGLKYYDCNIHNLLETVLLNGVSSIPSRFFEFCTSLYSVQLYYPSVVEFGYSAFFECCSILSIYVPSSLYSDYISKYSGRIASLWGASKELLTDHICSELYSGGYVYFASASYWGYDIFSSYVSERVLTGPNNNLYSYISDPNSVYQLVTNMGYLHSVNSQIVSRNFLQYINLSGCLGIGSSCFFKCVELSVASFPICQRIFDSAFACCSVLAEVYFDKVSAVPQIGSLDNVFYSCPALTSIYVPTSLLESFKTTSRWSSLKSLFVGV